MEDKLLKIINHYGVRAQLKHLSTELFELDEAIFILQDYEEFANDQDYQPTLKKQKEHIAEEIADVMVMLEQFKLYYGISSEDVTKIFWEKVDRQLGRIDKEDKECS